MGLLVWATCCMPAEGLWSAQRTHASCGPGSPTSSTNVHHTSPPHEDAYDDGTPQQSVSNSLRTRPPHSNLSKHQACSTRSHTHHNPHFHAFHEQACPSPALRTARFTSAPSVASPWTMAAVARPTAAPAPLTALVTPCSTPCTARCADRPHTSTPHISSAKSSGQQLRSLVTRWTRRQPILRG